jgi:hypothetical protein
MIHIIETVSVQDFHFDSKVDFEMGFNLLK